jgi:hypothetical protein
MFEGRWLEEFMCDPVEVAAMRAGGTVLEDCDERSESRNGVALVDEGWSNEQHLPLLTW